MAKRHELTDEGWALIADFFPAQGRGGKWSDHRTILNGIFWRLRTGAAWRDLPERYGPWQTVHDRFNAMRADGSLDRLLDRLQARLNADGLIDAELGLSITHKSQAHASAGFAGVIEASFCAIQSFDKPVFPLVFASTPRSARLGGDLWVIERSYIATSSPRTCSSTAWGTPG